MNSDLVVALQDLATLVIKVVFLVLTIYIIPWVDKQILKSRIGTLVTAAEQYFAGEDRGEEKFAWVTAQLEKARIKITDEVVDYIESAVFKETKTKE